MQMIVDWQSTDSSVSSLGPESGHTGQQCRDQRSSHEQSRGQSLPLSSIRTMTVGFGFAPNLLTLPALSSGQALAGSCCQTAAVTAGGELHPALRTLPPHRRRHDYGDKSPEEQLPSHPKNGPPHSANACVGGDTRGSPRVAARPARHGTPNFCHQQTSSR
jgi:hypothetical protein